MESGWNNNEGSNIFESDEGSSSEVRNDLVVDQGENIPNQNSNPIQVVEVFLFSATGGP